MQVQAPIQTILRQLHHHQSASTAAGVVSEVQVEEVEVEEVEVEEEEVEEVEVEVVE
jgi:hypothetical protein